MAKNSYNHGHNILRLLLVYHFFTPQVKQSVIISNKHGIYESPNDLRLSHFIIFFSPQVKQSVIISNKHGIYELPNELET